MHIKVVAAALPTKQDVPAATLSINMAISGLHSSSLQICNSSLNGHQLQHYSLKSSFMAAHKVAYVASQGTLKDAQQCTASFLYKRIPTCCLVHDRLSPTKLVSILR